MDSKDLVFKSVAQLSRFLRTGKLSSVEVTRYFLDRLEQLGPHYNALAELTRDLAMRQARRADKLVRGGEGSPLLGIPYGAKDLLATKDIPTRWGAAPFRRQVFDYDATVIQRMRESGAVLIGKLAMVELAGGGGYASANASLHGPGLNPWNIRRWSGGSSSGSGSAVAAGLVPFALGSETWGSIVTPSTYCGITGLRPTWGRVSRHGAMELAWSMDRVGPMAQTAEDCGLVLRAIAGEDTHDSSTVDRPAFKFKPHAPRRGFRLGVLPADFSGEPEIERAFAEALRVLRSAGMKTARVDWPEHPYAEIARTILDGEMSAAHEKFIRSKRLSELVDANQKRGLKQSLRVTAAEYLRAQSERGKLAKEIFGLLNDYDAFVSPSLVIEAVTLDTNLQTAFRKRGGYSVLGALFGMPALTMPMGFGRHGLPLGITLTGKLFDENTLLQMGMIYQRETNWHQMHPM
jgi:aspartyl-tRNA(Asn)/glutamyl-tRNA(Gln) amidotransferase subunit A